MEVPAAAQQLSFHDSYFFFFSDISKISTNSVGGPHMEDDGGLKQNKKNIFLFDCFKNVFGLFYQKLIGHVTTYVTSTDMQMWKKTCFHGNFAIFLHMYVCENPLSSIFQGFDQVDLFPSPLINDILRFCTILPGHENAACVMPRPPDLKKHE